MSQAIGLRARIKLFKFAHRMVKPVKGKKFDDELAKRRREVYRLRNRWILQTLALEARKGGVH